VHFISKNPYQTRFAAHLRDVVGFARAPKASPRGGDPPDVNGGGAGRILWLQSTQKKDRSYGRKG
jgi:hypothetical protein